MTPRGNRCSILQVTPDTSPLATLATTILLIAAFWTAVWGTPARADCNWAEARIEIDKVLTGDAQRAAEFRRLVGAGRDSLDTLMSLVPETSRKAVDDCTVQTTEYLTNKGFPLLH